MYCIGLLTASQHQIAIFHLQQRLPQRLLVSYGTLIKQHHYVDCGIQFNLDTNSNKHTNKSQPHKYINALHDTNSYKTPTNLLPQLLPRHPFDYNEHWISDYTLQKRWHHYNRDSPHPYYDWQKPKKIILWVTITLHKKLISAPGLSGYENPVSMIMRKPDTSRWWVTFSKLGSLHGIKKRLQPEPRPRILIAVHMMRC